MSRLATAALVCLASFGCASAAVAQVASCTKFRDGMIHAGGDMKIDFVRPLVVSRGGGGGGEQYDLTSNARIDGVLRCRGETFVSFEATVHMPADSALLDRFAVAQQAALVAGLGWSHSRAVSKVRAIAHEAADYLRGSAERGDVAVAGKLEEHLPGGVDLGVVWTQTERTFILINTD